MSISIFRAMPKGMNKGAYRGKLTCPVCDSEAIRFVEYITRFRLRYRCRKCGNPFQYDVSNIPLNPDGSPTAHPYGPWKKNRFQRVVERWRGAQKRRTIQ